ncbi:MAG: hypothetical protein N2652_02515 [Kiritimatiellae bacterium]|nr:hypothetical protein [Kiritimatiellia bacterium]
MNPLIVFDFATRTCRVDDASAAAHPGSPDTFVWLDVDLESASASEALAPLGLDANAAAFLMGSDTEPPAGAQPVELVELLAPDAPSVRCAMSEHTLVTAHRGAVGWLRSAAERSRDDFLRFARTRGFLLFELGAALLREVREAALAANDTAGRLAAELLAPSAAAPFERVGQAVRRLVELRLCAARAAGVFADLGTRRSAVVPESTQPYLRMLADRFDRVADELAVQREILNDAVQMQLGALGQRANQIMQRLTIVGTIFLPLTFLTGIYGMNMAIPEARWPGMYGVFWALCAVIAGALLVLMRRWGWW